MCRSIPMLSGGTLSQSITEHQQNVATKVRRTERAPIKMIRCTQSNRRCLALLGQEHGAHYFEAANFARIVEKGGRTGPLLTHKPTEHSTFSG